MRIHPIERTEGLKRLRRRGMSIGELVTLSGIPKTTVWHHVHAIRIPERYLRILKAKQGGSAKRSQKHWEKARIQAQELLTSNSRESALILAMLYWAEGHKRSCEFTNSDGAMVRIYVEILRKVFGIPAQKIKPTLRIVSGMDRKACLAYWSQMTGISKHKFVIRLNDGGNSGKTRYGMCRITAQKGGDALKLIMSLINQFSREFLAKL